MFSGTVSRSAGWHLMCTQLSTPSGRESAMSRMDSRILGPAAGLPSSIFLMPMLLSLSAISILSSWENIGPYTDCMPSLRVQS